MTNPLARKQDSPPDGELFVWMTEKMLASPAWISLPHSGRSVVYRIMLEYLQQGRHENGKLKVTYNDFEAYGIARKSIPEGIAYAEGLGFIRVQRGRPGRADNRFPSKYGLTWLWDRDFDAPPNNKWQRIKSGEDAEAILTRIKQERKGQRAKQWDQAKRLADNKLRKQKITLVSGQTWRAEKAAA